MRQNKDQSEDTRNTKESQRDGKVETVISELSSSDSEDFDSAEEEKKLAQL